LNKDTVSGAVHHLRPMNLYPIDTGFFKLDGGAMCARAHERSKGVTDNSTKH